MSSISSLGGAGTYQWFYGVASPRAKAGATGPTQVVQRGRDSDGDTDGSTPGSVDGSSSSAQGGFFKQLQDAVTGALGSTSNTTDPNTLIQAAIKQLFAGQSPSTSSTTGNTAAPTTDRDGDSDGSTSASDSTDSTNAAAPQSAFSQLLNSFGVSSQQFQQDVQTALQSSSSNGGAVDVSKLFKSFPPGSVIDTLA